MIVSTLCVVIWRSIYARNNWRALPLDDCLHWDQTIVWKLAKCLRVVTDEEWLFACLMLISHKTFEPIFFASAWEKYVRGHKGEEKESDSWTMHSHALCAENYTPKGIAPSGGSIKECVARRETHFSFLKHISYVPPSPSVWIGSSRQFFFFIYSLCFYISISMWTHLSNNDDDMIHDKK